MDKKTPVPSVAFDPAQHVLVGRRAHDGRQLFFSLASIVEAEKAIETPSQPVSTPDVTQADLERIEKKVLAAVQAAMPPPQFPVDVMGLLQETAGTLLKMKADNDALRERVAALEATVSVHTKNFQTFKEVTGAPV